MALTDNLIAYWELEEASGTRNDSHGSNHLSEHNSVGSATGMVGTAADGFIEDSSYLYRADNTDLSTGDIDFSVAAWVKCDSKTGHMGVAGKLGFVTGVDREWLLRYDVDVDRFEFFVGSSIGTSARIRADTLGSPSTGTWYYLVGWHDAANNLIGISVNAGTADTLSHSDGVLDSTTEFELGAQNTVNFFDGLIDQVGFWKKVLTSGERTSLYNGGAGLSYAALSAGGTTRGMPFGHGGTAFNGGRTFTGIIQ